MDHEDKPFSRSEIEWSLHGDSLTERLLEAAAPGNVRSGSSCCCVSLWPEWAQMLATLPSLGEVLVVTGNSGAILGERHVYPEFQFGERFRSGGSVGGELDAEFVPWHAADVVCHRHACGHFSHGIEFRDESNTVLHKVCLTENSDRDDFVEWFEHHQAIPGLFDDASSSISPSRWRTVQQPHWFSFDEIEELPGHALEGILRFAVERQAPVRLIIGNEGMVQSADCSPRCLHARQEWLFASDDRTGFHFGAGPAGGDRSSSGSGVGEPPPCAHGEGLQRGRESLPRLVRAPANSGSRLGALPHLRHSHAMKPPVTILFATMTGNAECCAIDLAHQLGQAGFSCRKENVSDYQVNSLTSESVVLLVASTWGEGEPPDDALPFFEDLQALPAGALVGVRFAVFALGDSSYDVFCGFGKNCDQALEAAGATRLLPCEECDLDQDEKLPGWAREVAGVIEAGQTEPALD